MRISEAAQRLGLSPRMLRYRESLGLLPAAREPGPGPTIRPDVLRGAQAAGPRPSPGPAPPGGTSTQAGRPGRPAPGGTPDERAVTGRPGPRAATGSVGSAARPPVTRRRATHGPAHRQFDADDLAVAALALDLERRLDVSPAELSFGIRVLAEPTVRAQVAGLARQLGRIPATPGRALDFEQERALRLLGRHQPRRAAAVSRDPQLP